MVPLTLMSMFPAFLASFMMSAIMLPDVTAAGTYKVLMEHMTSVKVPSYTEDGMKDWRFDSGSVRSVAYSADSQILYVVGGSTIHYINVSNPDQLRIIGHTSLPDATFYDVTTCGEYVLATYTAFNNSKLLVAKGYRHTQRRFAVVLLRIVYDKPEPVSLAVTADCETAVVAINGKATWDGKEFVDRQPAVVITSLSAILSRDTTDNDPIAVLDFRDLDERWEDLVKQGVRFPMKGKVGSLSQDLDPSDVTIDDVTRQAYVTLKVNNAVAVIDLTTNNVTEVISLGLKDWRGLDIDTSDENGVRFQHQPIYSMYQAGAIRIARHSGASYLLTANTGAKRDYTHIINWSEVTTGSELVRKGLVGNAVEPELVSALQNKSQLGSLQFTTENGHDDLSQNKMTKFLTFGARSFSLRELPDLDLVYDSGSDLEVRMAQYVPEIFNCPVKKGSNVVRYDRDLTSVSMGPKPISIATGKLGSLTLLMVGLANPGGVLMYSLSLESPYTPKFESLWLSLQDPLKSWDELYMESNLAAIGVTDVIYIPSHATRRGFPFLLVAGSKSGTVSALKVRGTGDIPDYNSVADSRATPSAVVLISIVLSALMII